MFEYVKNYFIFHELDQVHESFVWGQDPYEPDRVQFETNEPLLVMDLIT